MGSMENVSTPRKEEHKFELPAGFRFHPTDEELINQYLTKKVANNNFCAIAIAEVDLNRCEPWDLPGLAKMGETEWYFFCVRDRKYPTGLRTNRATNAGYWKATGKDKEITKGNALIGMKKTLVFYKGRAPKGEKTNWIMHEYRLEGNENSECDLPKPGKSEWVICRVFEKGRFGKKMHSPKFGRFNSFVEYLPSPSQVASLLPSLMDSSTYNSETRTTAGGGEFSSQVTCFSDPNQTENQKTQDYIVDSKEALDSSSSIPFDVSSFAKATPPLMENHIGGSSAKPNHNAEFSLGKDFDDANISSVIYNNDMFQKWFGNQEYSSASAGPVVDTDYLWNF